MAADPVDQLADHQHERVYPDDVQADHGEDVGLLVVVAHHDVAGQVHHARHHGEAAAARRAPLLGRRADVGSRAGARRAPSPRRARPPARARARSSAGRAGSARRRSPGPLRSRPLPARDDERVEREVLPGEQRAEDEWAEHGAEQRAEQHEIARARRSGRTMSAAVLSARAGPCRSSHRRPQTAHDEHRAVGLAAES